jgi:hypothetical protein
MRVNPQLAFQNCKEFESKLFRLKEKPPLRESSLEETK